MNIFFLDEHPFTAAKYHCDQHVSKMLIESCQILCTARHLVDKDTSLIPYKKTQVDHPSMVWARKSVDNYHWVLTLAQNLLCEYEFRFNKKHGCEKVVDWLSEQKQPDLPNIGLTPFEFGFDVKKHIGKPFGTPVDSYRLYYRVFKSDFKIKGKATWTKRDIPEFMYEGEVVSHINKLTGITELQIIK